MIAVFRRVVFASAIGILGLGAAHADNRVALVIGNSNYRSVTVLPNPVNDAKAIGGLLASAGFDVVTAPDLGQAEMRSAVRAFAEKIAAKGPDTTALVFYAGHGLQVDGENFLVPVDARIQRESDVAIEAFRLGDLMTALASVPAKMRIVILDACRNNPFTQFKQTGGKGLAIVDAPTGSIVAYSTAPGTEATDGAGANSPYTTALVDVAHQPKMPIEQVFKQVRLKVHQATAGGQTPWESSSLTGDFWFLPFGAEAVAAVNTPAVVATAPAADNAAPAQAQTVAAFAGRAPVAPEQRRAERLAQIRTLPPERAYELVVEEDAVEFYEEYVLVYPTVPFAERVRRMLARRVDAMAWRHATVSNTPDAYAAYAATYPGGDHAGEAVRLQIRPRARSIDRVFVPRVIVPPPPVRIALPIFQPKPPSPPRPTFPVNLPQNVPLQPKSGPSLPGQVSPVVSLPTSAKPGQPTLPQTSPVVNLPTSAKPGQPTLPQTSPVVSLPTSTKPGQPTLPQTSPVVNLPTSAKPGQPTLPQTSPVVNLPTSAKPGQPTLPQTSPVVSLPTSTKPGQPTLPQTSPVVNLPTSAKPGQPTLPQTSPVVNLPTSAKPGQPTLPQTSPVVNLPTSAKPGQLTLPQTSPVVNLPTSAKLGQPTLPQSSPAVNLPASLKPVQPTQPLQSTPVVNLPASLKPVQPTQPLQSTPVVNLPASLKPVQSTQPLQSSPVVNVPTQTRPVVSLPQNPVFVPQPRQSFTPPPRPVVIQRAPQRAVVTQRSSAGSQRCSGRSGCGR